MRRSSQSGNAAFFAVLAIFLLAVGGGVYYAFGPGGTRGDDEAARAANAAFDAAVAQVTQAFGNPAAISMSLDKNAAFQCLYSLTGGCQNQGGTFLLYDGQNGTHPLSQLGAEEGQEPSGAACRTFPGPECPLRVETVWTPVCGGDTCEGTKGFHVHAKVTLAPLVAGGAPREWSKEDIFTPEIRLSAAVQCARNAGIWSGSECLTPSQAAERRLASPAQAQSDPAATSNLAPLAENPPASEVPMVYQCPAQIAVYQQFFPAEFVAADRAQVTAPSMACQQPGHVDVFVFKCVAKTPPVSFAEEGQWVQQEAVIDPPCDANGNPIGAEAAQPVRF